MDDNLPEFSDLKGLSNKELLLILLERLRVVSINQTNHLRHHWAITVVCVSAGVIGIFNLCIAMLVIFLNGR